VSQLPGEGSATVCEPRDGYSPFRDRWGPHYAEDVSAGFRHGRDEGGFLIFTCEACGVQAKEAAPNRKVWVIGSAKA